MRKSNDVKSCAACHQTWYCGKECQRADWPNHKQWCRSVGLTVPGKIPASVGSVPTECVMEWVQRNLTLLGNFYAKSIGAREQSYHVAMIVRERRLLGVSVDTAPQVQTFLKKVLCNGKYESMLEQHPKHTMIVTVMEHRNDGVVVPCFTSMFATPDYQVSAWTRPAGEDWKKLMSAQFP